MARNTKWNTFNKREIRTMQGSLEEGYGMIVEFKGLKYGERLGYTDLELRGKGGKATNNTTNYFTLFIQLEHFYPLKITVLK